MFCVLSIHLIVSSLLSLICLTPLIGGQHRKKILHKYPEVLVKLPNGNGNGRKLGIARCEKKTEMGFKFPM